MQLIDEKTYKSLDPFEQQAISSTAAQKILEVIKHYDDKMSSFSFSMSFLEEEEKLFNIVLWHPMTSILAKDMKSKLQALKYVHKMTIIRNYLFVSAFVGFMFYKALS